MNTLYLRVRPTHLVAGLLVLLLTTSSLAKTNPVEVPFLFNEDEKLDQTELISAIPRSSDLQSDPYLNAPMTRLEYMLTVLEAGLNSEQSKRAVRSQLSDGFELSQTTDSISIEGFATYRREHGHIVAGYTIRDLGRPKRPMRTTCDALLSVPLNLKAPQANMGFLLHNTVLGVLAHEDTSTYTPVMETLARNIVQAVYLQSTTGDLSVMHGLSCQRIKKGAPVQYARFSAKFH